MRLIITNNRLKVVKSENNNQIETINNIKSENSSGYTQIEDIPIDNGHDQKYAYLISEIRKYIEDFYSSNFKIEDLEKKIKF